MSRFHKRWFFNREEGGWMLYFRIGKHGFAFGYSPYEEEYFHFRLNTDNILSNRGGAA